MFLLPWLCKLSRSVMVSVILGGRVEPGWISMVAYRGSFWWIGSVGRVQDAWSRCCVFAPVVCRRCRYWWLSAGFLRVGVGKYCSLFCIFQLSWLHMYHLNDCCSVFISEMKPVGIFVTRLHQQKQNLSAGLLFFSLSLRIPGITGYNKMYVKCVCPVLPGSQIMPCYM